MKKYQLERDAKIWKKFNKVKTKDLVLLLVNGTKDNYDLPLEYNAIANIILKRLGKKYKVLNAMSGKWWINSGCKDLNELVEVTK